MAILCRLFLLQVQHLSWCDIYEYSELLRNTRKSKQAKLQKHTTPHRHQHALKDTLTNTSLST